MKKFLPLFLILFFTSPKVFAQDIVTGDASAKSTVVNEVSGNADVYTKIEVSANGEKKVLETTEPGEHTLEVNSDSEASAQSEITVEKNTDEGMVEKEKKEEVVEDSGFDPASIIKKISENIVDFFKNIFSLF